MSGACDRVTAAREFTFAFVCVCVGGGCMCVAQFHT